MGGASLPMAPHGRSWPTPNGWSRTALRCRPACASHLRHGASKAPSRKREWSGPHRCPHALLEIGLEDAEVVLVAVDGPLQGAEQALGGIEAQHESVREL